MNQRPDRRVEDDFVGLLSPGALARLPRLGAVREPHDRADRHQLKALLTSVGLVGFEAAFDIEEKFGGLALDSGRFRLGIHAVIRDAMDRGESGNWCRELPGALPLATWRDGTAYLATDGSVHLLCYELDRFERIADSAQVMLERRLYSQPESRFAHTVTVEALIGVSLAESMGLTKAAEVSDSVESTWIGRDLEVHERRWGEQPGTEIHGNDPKCVAATLARALELSPGATHWPDLDVAEALAGRQS